MGNVQEDGLAHLATDIVHYNPGELDSWFDSMLTELNPPATSGFQGLKPVLPYPAITTSKPWKRDLQESNRFLVDLIQRVNLANHTH